MENEEKGLSRLRQLLGSQSKVAVAYSGGVDSSVVLKVAREELGERAIAVMNVSPLTPPGEEELAIRTARTMGVEPIITRADPLEDAAFQANPEDRCYRCKRIILGAIAAAVRERGDYSIVDGSQTDDLKEDRPGRRALAEAGVRSPLIEAGLGKNEVRSIARQLSIPVADRPANPCLATRIPFHQEVTMDKLQAVGESERVLLGMGLSNVRVRHHGAIARIESPPEEISVIINNRERVVSELKRLGFTYIVLDLQGFRSGSMSEALLPERQRGPTLHY